MKQVLEGLQILAKYFEKGNFSAEHDEIYAGDSASEVEISAEDLAQLDTLGWFVDAHVDSWKKFV